MGNTSRAQLWIIERSRVSYWHLSKNISDVLTNDNSYKGLTSILEEEPALMMPDLVTYNNLNSPKRIISFKIWQQHYLKTKQNRKHFCIQNCFHQFYIWSKIYDKRRLKSLTFNDSFCIHLVYTSKNGPNFNVLFFILVVLQRSNNLSLAILTFPCFWRKQEIKNRNVLPCLQYKLQLPWFELQNDVNCRFW